MGNHKGCPYGRLVGAYFPSNDSEMGPDHSWKSILATPVSPAAERLWVVFWAFDRLRVNGFSSSVSPHSVSVQSW